MTATDTMRTALFGDPPQAGYKPSREGVLSAFQQLSDLVSITGVGISYFDSNTAMNAVVPGDDDPKVAIVTGAGAGIYAYRGGAWQAFNEFFTPISNLLKTDIFRNGIAKGTAIAPNDNPNEWTVSFTDGASFIGRDLIRLFVPATTTNTVYINTPIGRHAMADGFGPGGLSGPGVTYNGGEFMILFFEPGGGTWQPLYRSGVLGEAYRRDVAVATTVGGTPNAITLEFANQRIAFGIAPGPLVYFQAASAEYNTEAMTINGFNVLNAANGPVTAGSVGNYAGYLLMWMGAPGNAFKLINVGGGGGSSNNGTDLVAKFVRDFHASQWNLDGTPVEFPITAAGSSVTTEFVKNRAGATDYAPSHRLVDYLNGPAPLPGDTGIPLGARVPGALAIDDNWSHGGHVIVQFMGQIEESPYWQAGTTKALFLAPGPNDFQIPSYNTGETFNSYYTVLESIVLAGKARGIPTFIATPFDPDMTQTNYASFYGGNPTIPQYYPTPYDAPVDPETEQYPPASDSVGQADMTGRGVPIPFDRRFEHGTMAVRALAAAYPECVVLIDSRKAYHRAVEALMPNAYEKRILYPQGDFIHPARYSHDRGFGFPLMDLAQDILAGGVIERRYDGGNWRNYGQ